MDFKDIIKRAVKIRAKYSEFEKKKWGKEWTPQQRMQGLVTDIGDLMRLVMAKEGLRDVENLDKKLAHELVDCLWSLIIVANDYGVDLEKEFPNKMDELEKKLISK